MEGVLNQVLSGHKTTHKQLEKNNTLLGSILGVQSNILNVEKERLKQDRRDAQAKARADADSKKKDNQLKKILDAINKGGKDTEKSIFEKIFDGIKGVGGGLMNAILASLGLGAGVSLIDKILGRLGLGKKGAKSKGFFTDIKRNIRKFTIGIQRNIRSIFGKGGFFGKMFGKGSFLGKALGKFKPGNLIKGGGIFAAITSGITEFFDSGKLTDALFASVGGGAGAIAGGALGSLLGPVGTVVGAALGSWIGTELTGILKEQLDKVPFLKDTFAFIDAEFNKMLDSFNNLFSAVQTTFGQFTDMVDVLFKSVQRFYKDAFQPIFDSIVSFYEGAWTKLVEGFTFVGDWFSSTFEPTLIKIGDVLKPIIDPLKELADKILPPLEAGLKGLGEFLKPFLNPGKMFVDGIADNVTNAGNFFKGIADYFRDYSQGNQLGGVVGYQTGGFVGTVPNQGGNGDRFGAMVSPGSVVLNQTASNMMQSGGMVPTMLEQGEKVYAPSDPMAGTALMMNSMIPRFQEGGSVGTLLSTMSTALSPLVNQFGDHASMALGPLAGLAGLSGAASKVMGTATNATNALSTAGKSIFDFIGGGMGTKSKGQAGGAVSADQLYASMGFSKSQWDVYRNTVAQIESGGKYDIAGGSGGHYDGRYQLGAAAKTDGARYAGVVDPGHGAGARAAYRKDPEMQEKLFAGFTKANYQYLMGNSKFANSSKERQLQILGYAHNQGMGGAENWMTTGKVGLDGFGTKGTKYTNSIAAEFKKASKMQQGGLTQVRGTNSTSNANMISKSQENFAKMIAENVSPVIVPIPMGGGGSAPAPNMNSADLPFPSLPAEDNSIVSMEYKYRITMGASV